MKILILEGIATSGKSSTISSLQKALPNSKVLVVGESETHEPIMDQTNEKHLVFFKTLINQSIAKNPDVLIFDRLYLTQAIRSKSNIDDFAEIEELLSKYSPITIFLKVDEDAILDRISKSSEDRGSDYFKSRGRTPEERAQYYINQQKQLLKLLDQSKLPYKVINTSDHNYDTAVKNVLLFI